MRDRDDILASNFYDAWRDVLGGGTLRSFATASWFFLLLRMRGKRQCHWCLIRAAPMASNRLCFKCENRDHYL